MFSPTAIFVGENSNKWRDTFSFATHAHRKITPEKYRLHARNRERYDLGALIIAIPGLKAHVKPNKYGTDSVDFSDPVAVVLNI